VKENTMTKTTLTIEERLAEAEAEADKASAQARQLRATKEAAEAEAKDQADEGRDEFEEQRAKDFEPVFAKAVRQAGEAFDQAVVDGGDVVAAWTNYQRAIAVAAEEERRFTHWRWERAREVWEAKKNQLNAFNRRIDRLPNLAPPIPATGRRRYDPVVVMRKSGGKSETPSIHPQVRELNEEINQWARDNVLDYKRDLANTERIYGFSEIIGTEPRPKMTAGHRDKWERRSFTKAFEEAAKKAADSAAAEHRKSVRTHITALAKDDAA